MDTKNQQNNFNNPIVILLVLVLIGLGGYVLFSKNSDNSNQNQATTSTQVENQISPSPAVQNQQKVQPKPQPSYTAPRYYAPMTFSVAVEAQRSSYVNGCTSSGGMWGKCNCGFDYLISNYGLVWLINEEAYINVNGVASSQLRSASSDSVKYCSVFSN